jgi:hypothetical protein
MNVKDPVRNILLKLEGINMFLCASCRALIFDLQIWLMALSPSHQWRKSCCEPQRTRRAHHSNGRHGRYFFPPVVKSSFWCLFEKANRTCRAVSCKILLASLSTSCGLSTALSSSPHMHMEHYAMLP